MHRMSVGGIMVHVHGTVKWLGKGKTLPEAFSGFGLPLVVKLMSTNEYSRDLGMLWRYTFCARRCLFRHVMLCYVMLCYW
jgi:hypothetical protein